MTLLRSYCSRDFILYEQCELRRVVFDMSAECVNPPTLYLLQYPDCRNLQIDCALEGCVRKVN